MGSVGIHACLAKGDWEHRQKLKSRVVLHEIQLFSQSIGGLSKCGGIERLRDFATDNGTRLCRSKLSVLEKKCLFFGKIVFLFCHGFGTANAVRSPHPNTYQKSFESGRKETNHEVASICPTTNGI